MIATTAPTIVRLMPRWIRKARNLAIGISGPVYVDDTNHNN